MCVCVCIGHAYAAAIGACAAGQDWQRAVALFDDMTSRASIRPDVVSCTALVSALASAGEADKAEAVVTWMQKNGLKPNVSNMSCVRIYIHTTPRTHTQTPFFRHAHSDTHTRARRAW